MSTTTYLADTNITSVTSSWIYNTTIMLSNVSRSIVDVTTNTQLDTLSTVESTASITSTKSWETTALENRTLPHYAYDMDYEYKHFMYTGYSFERPVYLYIWELLVILTSIVNVVVVFILLRRKMRNPTNVVLAAIAISDSLTGLSTLPTYILVYTSTSEHEGPHYVDNNSSINASYYGHMDHISQYYNPNYDDMYSHYMFTNPGNGSNHNSTNSADMSEQVEYDGYMLTKTECRWFMITKFFISKSFHSMSIYLTLFLGVQRFISVAAPFRAQSLTTEKAILSCAVIAILSPILHVFHLFDDKTERGMCEWDLPGDGCHGGCAELWIMFFIRNLIPCSILLLFTILFIRELHKGEVNIRRMDSNLQQINRRVLENRRIAIIVTAIVVVFLIPEIPYGFYLLYNAIDKTSYNGANMKLEVNRAIHMAYELLLVLSFHANFYIYTMFNRKFRLFLIKTFVQPVRRVWGDTRRVSISSSGAGSMRSTRRQTELMSMKSGTRNNSLKSTISNTLSRDTVESTAFIRAVTVDVTQASQTEHDHLQATDDHV